MRRYTNEHIDDVVIEEIMKVALTAPASFGHQPVEFVVVRDKRAMLTFRAYATVDSSNVSRWFNIKRVYEYLSEDLGVKRAIEDISNKLGMLADYQQDLESRRYATISWLITLFGIVSILASVLSIINFLNTGWRLYWIVTIVLSLLIVGTGLVALRFTRK